MASEANGTSPAKPTYSPRYIDVSGADYKYCAGVIQKTIPNTNHICI